MSDGIIDFREIAAVILNEWWKDPLVRAFHEAGIFLPHEREVLFSEAP